MNAKTTSPFSQVFGEDAPWILWKQQDSMFALQDVLISDVRSAFGDGSNSDEDDQSVSPVLKPPVIQRRQYNAILSRFNQASHRAGGFAAWTTT